MGDREVRRWVLVEEMASDMKAIKEYVSQIPTMQKDISDLKSDVVELKADVKEIKHFVGGHHEAIAKLEAASHTHP